MATNFTPFLMSPARQTIINKFNDNISQYNTNSAGNYRNPIFDLRTEQEQAGDLDPSARFPNPIFDTTAEDTTDDTIDVNGCIIGVETYDAFQGKCVPINQEATGDSSDDKSDSPEPVYQGVGSVFSPEQNAFMNLGLGSLTGGMEIPSRFQFDSAGNILKSALSVIPPFGLPLALGRMNDINTLLKAGVLEKTPDGKVIFAKGGNLKYVQANQEFEKDLARQQGLNLDAQADTPYDYRYNEETKQNEPVFMQQSRGDKADDMGNVYKGLDVDKNPFKSDYGASQIISYNSTPDPKQELKKQNTNYNQNQRTQNFNNMSKNFRNIRNLL